MHQVKRHLCQNHRFFSMGRMRYGGNWAKMCSTLQMSPHSSEICKFIHRLPAVDIIDKIWLALQYRCLRHSTSKVMLQEFQMRWHSQVYQDDPNSSFLFANTCLLKIKWVMSWDSTGRKFMPKCRVQHPLLSRFFPGSL